MATPRGFPPILTPPDLDLRAIQEAVDAARERIEKIEAAAASTGTQLQLASIESRLRAAQAQVAALTSQVNAFASTDTADADFVTLIAGEDLGNNTAVVAVSTQAVIAADGSTLTRAAALIGVTTTSATQGAPITVRRRGPITVSSAAFASGFVVYVGSMGTLTQHPGYEKVSVPVGLALSATEMWVEPGWPALYDAAFAVTEVPYSEFMPVTYKLLIDSLADAQSPTVLYDDLGRAILTVGGRELFVL